MIYLNWYERLEVNGSTATKRTPHLHWDWEYWNQSCLSWCFILFLQECKLRWIQVTVPVRTSVFPPNTVFNIYKTVLNHFIKMFHLCQHFRWLEVALLMYGHPSCIFNRKYPKESSRDLLPGMLYYVRFLAYSSQTKADPSVVHFQLLIASFSLTEVF